MAIVQGGFDDGLRISLVVPLRDEAGSIAALVASVVAQTRRPDEVVLVDGGSSDRTAILARALTVGHPEFRVVEAGPATPGRGRNMGIAAARHDWIALTDAGIRLEPTWLEGLVAVARRDPPVDVVYGNYEPVTDTWFEQCAALAYVAPKQHRAGKEMRGPSIASSLLRRGVWETVGGFPDLRAAEDLVFMRRVDARGFAVAWAPEATVWWQLRPSLWSTFRKFIQYSRANVWAGQQRYWQYGLARRYLACVPFVILAALHSGWWMVLPVTGILARVAKSAWVRREGRSVAWALNPLRLATVGVVLAAIDLATFWGWAQAQLGSPTGDDGTRPVPELARASEAQAPELPIP